MSKKQELTDLQILSSTVPFGIIRFEAGETPRITYISDPMLGMLGYAREGRAQKTKEGSAQSALELTKQNVYMLIPPEDRRRFSLYLSRVERHGTPISGEMDLLCFDGSRAHFFGWITRGTDNRPASGADDSPASGAADIPELFSLICIDIGKWSRIKKDQETKRYIKVLSSVYDDIFEFDYTAHTVKCVYSKRSPMLRWVRNVPLDMTEATNRWILRRVPAEEREKLRHFFAQGRDRAEGETEVRYSVMSSDGTTWLYKGSFVENGPSSYLFCCRKAYEEMPEIHRIWSGSGPKIEIRTFGYFDVFVDGKPIAFRSEKSKELFALLVDRRGGYVSSEEAIAFLWEDAPADTVTLSRYRKVAMRLKKTLEEYGISDAVESVSGKRRIATDRVSCDLYDYLSGKEEYAQLFKGSYLSNYSWAETTLAELQG